MLSQADNKDTDLKNNNNDNNYENDSDNNNNNNNNNMNDYHTDKNDDNDNDTWAERHMTGMFTTKSVFSMGKILLSAAWHSDYTGPCGWTWITVPHSPNNTNAMWRGRLRLGNGNTLFITTLRCTG